MRWLIRTHPAGTAGATKSSSSSTCRPCSGWPTTPPNCSATARSRPPWSATGPPTADWGRLVVDPVTGHLLDYGSVIYRPPAELADYVMARDRRCRFPGCNTRATVCDIDHNIPAPRGDTSASQLLLPLPPPPPTQNLRRLDRPTPTRRQLPMDITMRPPIRLRPTTPTRLKAGRRARRAWARLARAAIRATARRPEIRWPR